MKCAVRQTAVCRSGDVCAGAVKVIDAAGGEGKLLVRMIFHRQRNVCEITCIIGIIIAVILFAEDLQGDVYKRQALRRDLRGQDPNRHYTA